MGDAKSIGASSVDEGVTLEAVLENEDAEREIVKAVRGRRGIARKYVKWVRRRNPRATPAEVVTLLERHYVTAISAAGAAVTVGGIAAEVGIAMIPVVGPAAAGGKAVVKEVAKSAALTGAKMASERAVSFLPAGDQQLQFEITAVFALGLADIHGMELDEAQSQALIHGLSNERVAPQQIAEMANDLAKQVDSQRAPQPKEVQHWANTLADALPGGAAQSLVRGVQTGSLEKARASLGEKEQAAVQYGAGALVGGVTRFVFGREVVNAARVAFAAAPESFPDHLAIARDVKSEASDEEHNRAFEALTSAGELVGARISAGAVAVGTGAANAAVTVSRPFRRVDLDGDGIPDEARALTTAKNVGGAIAGVAGGLRARLARGRKSNSDGPTEGTQAN